MSTPASDFDLDDFAPPAAPKDNRGMAVDLVIVDDFPLASPPPPALPAELALVVSKSGLELQTAQALQEAFAPLFAQAQKWVALVDAINVTDASQEQDMAQAREVRLELKKVRVAADKKRKALKDESLKRGKAIDGIYNVLEYIVEPLEARLLEQEEFVKRAEAARVAALKAEREGLLAPYGVDTTCYDLGAMAPEMFAQLLETAKRVAQEREEAARQMEAGRIAREKLEVEARARIVAENLRLKAEAAERDRLAKIERDEAAKKEKAAKAAADAELARVKAEADKIAAAVKAEADAKLAELKKENDAKDAAALAERNAAEAVAMVEREAREKAEAELKRKEEEETKRVAAEKAAAAKAERAPDREKVRAMVGTLRCLKMPPAATAEGRAVFAELDQKIASLVAWAEEKGGAL